MFALQSRLLAEWQDPRRVQGGEDGRA
jgi:hypothetical protein